MSLSFLGFVALYTVNNFLSLGPLVWDPPLSILTMVPSILQEGLPSCLSLWWVLGFEKVSRSSEVLFSYFFLHLCLFDSVHFQYSQVLVIFFFQVFWFFLDLAVLFLPSFFFSLFIISIAHFSMSNSIPISWLYILNVCIRVSRIEIQLFFNTILAWSASLGLVLNLEDSV